MKVQNPINQSGYFWLPDTPEIRAPGSLKINENGQISIDIIGSLREKEDFFSQQEPNLGRVNGLMGSGKMLTLENCICASSKRSLAGVSTYNIHANTAFIGAAFEKGEPIEFDRLIFSVEGLDEWLGITGIKVTDDLNSNVTTITYSAPDQKTLHRSERIHLETAFTSSIPIGPIGSELKITQKAFFSAKFKEKMPIDELLKYAAKIQNFLCFAIDKTVLLNSIIGYTPDLADYPGGEGIHNWPIEIYHQSTKDSEVTTKIQRTNMFFHFDEVAENIQSILEKWLINHEKSAPAFNLYFASKAGSHRYLEGRFLSLAQGIETLHRRNSEETLIPEDTFSALLDGLVDACPLNQKEWLKMRLQYANELPLRQRLKQMLVPFEQFFGDQAKRKAFIDRTVNTRNYLTHYDPRLASQAATDKSLLDLCNKLEALFQIHFLKLIGIDNKTMGKFIMNNRTLRWKLQM